MKMLLTITLALLPLTAFAQDSARPTQYEEVTNVDFERALELEGELVRPRANLVVEARKNSFNPLIRLRVNFNDRMTLAAREML